MRQTLRTAAHEGSGGRSGLSVSDPQSRIDALEVELARALAQQTATTEVLGVINSSPGDLAPVFDAMLEKAMHLCEAAFGVLLTYNGEAFHAVAEHGIPPAFADFLRQPLRPAPGNSAFRLVNGEDVVQIADLLEDEATRLGNAARRAVIELGGARTQLMIALRTDAALLGMVQVYRKEVRLFTDQQIALLQNFAAQAVIAMENARLITETREALEQQTATAEVLGVINASPGDLAPVFDAMLDKATDLCAAAFGILWTFDGQHYRAVAFRNVPEPYAEFLRDPPPATPQTPLGHIAAGEPFSHIPDMAADEIYEAGGPLVRRSVELGGFRSIVGVPLRKDTALLGAITIYRQEVRPFSDKQIALLQNFAAQAVIAMENARLITETREALEQQTATAEVLAVINSSPGDLAPVFEAMLEKATRVCGADAGVLCTYDGECFSPTAWRGFDEFPREPIRPHPDTGIGRLARGEDIVHIFDSAAGEAYRSGDPGRLAIVQLGGARSQLTAALRKDEALLGSFTLWRREVRAFTDKQIALLQNFAAQAVIAMENARLINETRDALEQQTATADVLGVINSSPGDLAAVFDAMLEKAMRLCAANCGVLATYDGELFHRVARRGLPRQYDEHLKSAPLKPGPSGAHTRLLQGEAFVHIADIAREERADSGGRRPSTGPDSAVARAAIVDLGRARTTLVVALRRDDAVLGSFTIYRQEVRPFTDKQIGLVRNFAAQAVIAMENARLLGELRQRTEEVAELNRGLEARVAEQVEELGRVGRLKRFLAPQLAELIVSQGDEKILESHRREIVVVFCDLRGYTAFTETAEPEEVLDFLREYHGALGPLVSQFEGTLDQFSGDGIMVFFNDPVPIPDPSERAVKMAMAMREAAGKLITAWRPRGCELGFGAGIAWGYATLGQIGFADRSGYTAIGTVCNLAARLCDEAKHEQILVTGRVAAAVGPIAVLEEIGNLSLKGLSRPVVAFNVVQSASPAEARANLTIVARGPGT